MIRDFFTKLVADFKKLSPTAQGLIVVSLICLIGILLRWSDVKDGFLRGFDFFSKK